MSLFRRIEERAVGLSSSPHAFELEFPGMSGNALTKSGRRVTSNPDGPDSALRMVAVWACVSLIADGVSSLPVDVLVKDADGIARPVPAPPPWLTQPNPFQTPQAFWHRVVVSLTLDGNAFIAVTRNPRGQAVSLWAIDPKAVTIIEGPQGDDRYRVGDREFTRDDILHIPAFTVPGSSRGLCPIRAAQEAIGLGLTAEEFGARFFSQGTTMAGVIQHPGNPKADEARMLREMFRKTHSGVNNSHAVGVLTGGASWQSITITPEAAQFLDTRRFQKSEIALLYRVPAYMIDPTVTSSWGSGVEEQNQWFVQQTLMPWIVRIEQAVSTNLLAGKQYLRFNVDARLRPKTKDRLEAYSVGLDRGIYNLDEVRAMEDLPPLPKGLGKQHYRPSNLTNVDPKKAAAAAQAANPAPDPKQDPQTPSEGDSGSKENSPNG